MSDEKTPPVGVSFARIFGVVLISLTALLWFGAISLWTMAIWVSGPTAGKLGGTGGIALGTGIVCIVIGGILLDW